MFLPLGDDIQQRSFPIVPSVLIAINVLVFAYQVRISLEQPENPEVMMEFVQTWGLTPSTLAEGQVIGLLTHMFLHGGVMHLLGNMVVLWAFACSLETGLGAAYLLAFYIVWGLVAGAAHAATEWGSDIPLVGASGAIAGLIGAYTVAYGPQSRIRTLVWIWFRPMVVQIPAMIFGALWFGMQLWEASNDPNGMSGIAWFAHIGGFVVGALTMWCVRNQTDHRLIRDTSGELVFQQREVPPDEVAVETELPQPSSALPESCPYCSTSLEEATQLAPTLKRCGNPACERLVFLGNSLVTA